MSACGKGIQTLLVYLGCLKYKVTHHFLHSCPEQAADKLTQELLMDGNTISQPIPSGRVSFAGKVNSSYFQSNLKIRLLNVPKAHD